MISTGIRTSLGIKLYSDDLKNLIPTSIEIEKELKRISEFLTVYADRPSSKF
jgi:Cu/Ag efflux pump CusA